MQSFKLKLYEKEYGVQPEQKTEKQKDTLSALAVVNWPNRG